MEHWLPLFHERLETLFDYVGDAPVSFDHLAEEAVGERLALIADHYEARVKGLEIADLRRAALQAGAGGRHVPHARGVGRAASRPRRAPHDALRGGRAIPSAAQVRSFGGRVGRNFALERSGGEGLNVFDAAAAHVRTLQGQGKRVVVAAFTAGARERLMTLLGRARSSRSAQDVESFERGVRRCPPSHAAFAVLGVEQGFETADLAVIGEQDVLGDRLVRPRRKARRAADVITEATSLGVGDFVVHADHGIGRFDGLTTITALGAPHDCLEIAYAEGAKLYLPVENIELLSRYGSADGAVQLDRLGGVAWQTRKARLKQRIRAIAAELIKIAALRQLREAPVHDPADGAFDEFVARFPYGETEDQTASIATVHGGPGLRQADGPAGVRRRRLRQDRGGAAAPPSPPRWRASRWRWWCRRRCSPASTSPPSPQRFKGLPVRIAQASRLVAAKELAAVKAGLKDGTIDIVVGTHALLGKAIAFKRLGLLVVDEEQHFGVVHKERLKQLREDVHVLTLTATPIPRTLQLALSGVRELSLITTPPVDRLAVRTYISPFDPVIVREALAARALPRRAELLRRAAHRRPGGGGRVPRRAHARAEGGARARPARRRARSRT